MVGQIAPIRKPQWLRHFTRIFWLIFARYPITDSANGSATDTLMALVDDRRKLE